MMKTKGYDFSLDPLKSGDLLPDPVVDHPGGWDEHAHITLTGSEGTNDVPADEQKKDFKIAGFNGYIALIMVAGLILIFSWK